MHDQRPRITQATKQHSHRQLLTEREARSSQNLNPFDDSHDELSFRKVLCPSPSTNDLRGVGA